MARTRGERTHAEGEVLVHFECCDTVVDPSRVEIRLKVIQHGWVSASVTGTAELDPYYLYDSGYGPSVEPDWASLDADGIETDSYSFETDESFYYCPFCEDEVYPEAYTRADFMDAWELTEDELEERLVGEAPLPEPEFDVFDQLQLDLRATV